MESSTLLHNSVSVRSSGTKPVPMSKSAEKHRKVCEASRPTKECVWNSVIRGQREGERRAYWKPHNIPSSSSVAAAVQAVARSDDRANDAAVLLLYTRTHCSLYRRNLCRRAGGMADRGRKRRTINNLSMAPSAIGRHLRTDQTGDLYMHARMDRSTALYVQATAAGWLSHAEFDFG